MADITTAQVRERLVEFVQNHSEMSIRAIASMLDVPYSTLSKLLADAGYRRRQYRKLAGFDLGKLEE